jgi:hypothetical protein
MRNSLLCFCNAFIRIWINEKNLKMREEVVKILEWDISDYVFVGTKVSRKWKSFPDSIMNEK